MVDHDIARAIVVELKVAQRRDDSARPLRLAGGDLAHIGMRPAQHTFGGAGDPNNPHNPSAKVTLDVEHRDGRKVYVINRWTLPTAQELCFIDEDRSDALFAFVCAIEQCTCERLQFAAAWVEHRAAIRPDARLPRTVDPTQVLLVIHRADQHAGRLDPGEGPWKGFGAKEQYPLREGAVVHSSTGSAEPEVRYPKLERALGLVEKAFTASGQAGAAAPQTLW